MKKQSTQTIKVKSNEQDPEPLELLAKSTIEKILNAGPKLKAHYIKSVSK